MVEPTTSIGQTPDVLQELRQTSDMDALVILYQLDTTPIGGSTVIYFTPMVDDGDAVIWDGDTYNPLDVQSEGFEFKGEGELPKPRIRASNAQRVLSSFIHDYEDLLGCHLYRIRTLRKYLDGYPDEDPTAHFPVDLYVVSKKISENKLYVEWELAAYLDFEGTLIPKRQVLQNTCLHTYRWWDPDAGPPAFQYDNVTCPYTDSNYFDRNGDVVVGEEDDNCGRRLTDCKLRFPNDPLPTRSFPGVARTRIR